MHHLPAALDALAVPCRYNHARVEEHAVDRHIHGDVLDRLWTEIIEAQHQLAFDVIEHCAGNQNAAWVSECLQAGGNVDPITIEIAPVNDHVAEVDADAKPHLPLLW